MSASTILTLFAPNSLPAERVWAGFTGDQITGVAAIIAEFPDLFDTDQTPTKFSDQGDPAALAIRLNKNGKYTIDASSIEYRQRKHGAYEVSVPAFMGTLRSLVEQAAASRFPFAGGEIVLSDGTFSVLNDEGESVHSGSKDVLASSLDAAKAVWALGNVSVSSSGEFFIGTAPAASREEAEAISTYLAQGTSLEA